MQLGLLFLGPLHDCVHKENLMKKELVLLMTVALAGVLAQTPPPSPAGGRGPAPGFGFGAPAVRSPEVSADRRVTFRLRAPNANEVQVRGITQQPIPMVKDAEG